MTISFFLLLLLFDLFKKVRSLPDGANVPALGLSNKAIFDYGDDNDNDQARTTVIDENPMTVDGLYKEGYFKATVLNGRLKHLCLNKYKKLVVFKSRH